MIRFKAPLEGETVLDDQVQGEIIVANKDLDDLVILRSDGSPTSLVSTQAETAPSTTAATQVTVEDPAPGPDSPALNTQEPTDHSAQDESTPSRFGGAESLSAVPSNLAIPFDPSELAFVQGFLSPFGVVRSLKDRPEFGHSGIDVPLVEGAAILAVADGTVISVLPAEPKFPGEIVLLLINPGDQEGEGWVFLMEHVELSPGVSQGDRVTRGQQIGTSAIPSGRGNTHMQLSYYFNAFEYSREHTCWVNSLDGTARAELDESFAQLFGDGRLAASWNSAPDGSAYPLKDLPDDPRFPGGPQPCYPPGTDVRLPAE